MMKKTTWLGRLLVALTALLLMVIPFATLSAEGVNHRSSITYTREELLNGDKSLIDHLTELSQIKIAAASIEKVRMQAAELIPEEVSFEETAEPADDVRAINNRPNIPRIDPDKPMIALTFDDGPGKYEQRILDALDAAGGHATFFYLGSRIASYPNAVMAVIAQGSEVSGHSFAHANLNLLSVGAVRTDIQSTADAIIDAGGTVTSFFRPPYGNADAEVIAAAKELGMAIILWNVDTVDWKSRSADAVYQEILSHLKDGNIILCHSIYESTAIAVERAIPVLIARGFQLVTVSDLIANKSGEIIAGEKYYKQ
jgi:peptidoglycan/xylan/chitin deacetylase (PgdA/CDA1 family)